MVIYFVSHIVKNHSDNKRKPAAATEWVTVLFPIRSGQVGEFKVYIQSKLLQCMPVTGTDVGLSWLSVRERKKRGKGMRVLLNMECPIGLSQKEICHIS